MRDAGGALPGDVGQPGGRLGDLRLPADVRRGELLVVAVPGTRPARLLAPAGFPRALGVPGVPAVANEEGEGEGGAACA